MRLPLSMPESAAMAAYKANDEVLSMKQRFITGAVATAILIPVLIFADTLALPIGLAICSVIAVFEMIRCIGLQKAYVLNFPVYLAAGAFPFLVRYLEDLTLLRRAALVFSMVYLIYLFAVATVSHGKYRISDVCILFATSFYILVGFNAIILLHDCEPGGNLSYLTIFIGAWITDIFAYLCGMLFGKGGKHKLIPDVSPKKTVEGSIGGTVFCTLCMLLYGIVLQNVTDVKVNFLMLAIAGVLAAVVAQIGDLLMSLIKRQYGIKDYGKIFPGHGGMLDRFDSILAVAIILLAFSSYFNILEVI